MMKKILLISLLFSSSSVFAGAGFSLYFFNNGSHQFSITTSPQDNSDCWYAEDLANNNLLNAGQQNQKYHTSLKNSGGCFFGTSGYQQFTVTDIQNPANLVQMEVGGDSGQSYLKNNVTHQNATWNAFDKVTGTYCAEIHINSDNTINDSLTKVWGC